MGAAAPPPSSPTSTPEPAATEPEPEQLQLFEEFPEATPEAEQGGASSEESVQEEPVRGWPCIQCRHRNPHELDNCENCGTAFGEGLESSVVELPGTRGQRLLIAGGVAALFAVLFALVLGLLSGGGEVEEPVEVVPVEAPAEPLPPLAPTNPADQPPVIVFTNIPVPPPR